MFRAFIASFLEFHEDSSVELSASQIIRHGILLVGDIGHPVIAVYVVDAEEVEAIHAERHILEEGLLLMILVVEQLVAHSDVGAAIGCGAEAVGFQLSVWRGEWQTIGKGELQ